MNNSGADSISLWLDIEGALSRLHPREAEILRLRFGIGDRTHDRNELGARLGVPRGHVQRVETRALRKLRAAALEAFIPAQRNDSTSADDRA